MSDYTPNPNINLLLDCGRLVHAGQTRLALPSAPRKARRNSSICSAKSARMVSISMIMT